MEKEDYDMQVPTNVALELANNLIANTPRLFSISEVQKLITIAKAEGQFQGGVRNPLIVLGNRINEFKSDYKREASEWSANTNKYNTFQGFD